MNLELKYGYLNLECTSCFIQIFRVGILWRDLPERFGEFWES
ncbi:MAG: hypothetical protein AAGJ08_28630 [Cyanobacteria bacterium P01_H01_bin.35]